MVKEGLGGSRKVQEGLEVWHDLGGSWRIRESTRGSGRLFILEREFPKKDF